MTMRTAILAKCSGAMLLALMSTSCGSETSERSDPAAQTKAPTGALTASRPLEPAAGTNPDTEEWSAPESDLAALAATGEPAATHTAPSAAATPATSTAPAAQDAAAGSSQDRKTVYEMADEIAAHRAVTPAWR
ncbi:MAG: hypothetical protein ACYTCU_04655, partial [Planctomycetota bacterium]